MKKFLLSALAVLVMGFSVNAQTVSTETNELNSTSNAKSENLNPRNYSFVGLTYSADLEFIDKGVYGIGGHIFDSKGFGGSMTMGWNHNSDLYQIKVGPNYCAPISNNAYFYVPLYAAMNCFFVDVDDDIDSEIEFGWGLDLVPSIGLKFKRFHIGAGLNLSWGEGSDEIRTGLTVNIGLL